MVAPLRDFQSKIRVAFCPNTGKQFYFKANKKSIDSTKKRY